MAVVPYRFPAQQEAFLRAMAEGSYRVSARTSRGPMSVSLVDRMPPVYQQALQGTCVANAVVALLEFYGDLKTRLSVQFLHAATKEIEWNGLVKNLGNLRTGGPLDAGFESVFHTELLQLRMLADANGGMNAPAVRPYLTRFDEAVRARFAVAPAVCSSVASARWRRAVFAAMPCGRMRRRWRRRFSANRRARLTFPRGRARMRRNVGFCMVCTA